MVDTSKLPVKVYSIGFSMECRHVLTECIIHSLMPERNQMVVESEGLKFLDDMNYLKGERIERDYFPYTEESRKLLQNFCDNEYNEWLKRIERVKRNIAEK